MTLDNSLNILAENIFIDKIKNKKISINKIHKYWKNAREDAKDIIKTKKLMNRINKIINNIYDFIIFIINIIISIILVYILLYIYCFIYVLL
jgi:predicted PurR-regulated permease PerM